MPATLNFPLPAGPAAGAWNTLPHGCGGLVTGMFIANDGSMVCRTDVGNLYRWTGLTTDYANPTKRWVPLMTFARLAGQGPGGSDEINTGGGHCGGWEHVLAPNHSNVHAAIFPTAAGEGGRSYVWYSTNSATTWSKSNVQINNDKAGANGDLKSAQQKIAIDPANPNVAYCGVPAGDGNTAGAFTSLNKTGGSTLSTWTSVKTSGSTPVPATTNVISAGVAIDFTSGTTTIGGQTVTNRIIVPIGGSGIYESTDGGNTFTEVAASQIGTGNFYVINSGFTAEGIYYCIVVHPTVGGVWRYKTGTWTNITAAHPVYSPGLYAIAQTFLIIDPRNNPTSKAYLSVFGVNGIGVGFTSTNANTGSPPTWTGAGGGHNMQMRANSTYDLGYINQIFGQGPSFAYAVGAHVDPNGICWWPGNQSLFYFGVSDTDPTPRGPPFYVDYNVDVNVHASWSVGRGMEVVVSEDTLRPPGGTYPVLAVQDLGSPVRGTYTSYPQKVAVPYEEWTCEALEYAASDPSFIVARTTGQNGFHASTDNSRYSPNYGADDSWVVLAGFPTYNATITAGISNGAGGAGFILNVTACSGVIRETAFIATAPNTEGAVVRPYGTSGTTGTGGLGTYVLETSSFVAPGTTLYSNQFVQGGHTVAVDHDKWVTVPSGYGGQKYIPNFTTNATGAATWADCAGLPPWQWTLRGWAFGDCAKPFAVGYGTDLGTVWACQCPKGEEGTVTLYRSTNSGASFSPIGTFPIAITNTIYCLSVPGFPNELWITGHYLGGTIAYRSLMHVTNANTSSATFTAVNMPPVTYGLNQFTMGAPATTGGYPTLYAQIIEAAAVRLYEGQWNTSTSTMTWTLFGPTGTNHDLPDNNQLIGFQSIRGDFNTYRRLYASGYSGGFAYFEPE